MIEQNENVNEIVLVVPKTRRAMQLNNPRKLPAWIKLEVASLGIILYTILLNLSQINYYDGYFTGV